MCAGFLLYVYSCIAVRDMIIKRGSVGISLTWLTPPHFCAYLKPEHCCQKPCVVVCFHLQSQALVSFKKYMPPPLPYFKVNICPFPLPHFASIFSPYLWPLFVILSLTQLYRYTPEIFLFPTATFKYKLDKNIQRKSHFLFFNHWNGHSHFRSVLNWFRN